MPKAQIYFSEEEDSKIRKLSAKWNLSKHEAVKKIVREFSIVRKTIKEFKQKHKEKQADER